MVTLYHGDCLDVLRDHPDNHYDLIFTSPPYADCRKKTYGGIAPEKYVEWFLPRSKEFLRVLKPDGTFVLNIKEKVVHGERHTYVLELILALKKQGWLWTEEYIWHKKNSMPGKWKNRFRDAWERCLQFNKSKDFKMYQDEVMIPIGDWRTSRLKKLGKNDFVRHNSQNGSGFGRNVSKWLNKEMVYPTNVLHLPTVSSNKHHSAVFPLDLPMWFIKLFSKPGDIILDPFVGSGTTCLAAFLLGRESVGIDIKYEYITMASQRIGQYQKDLFNQPIQIFSSAR
ncbi:MAG: DNA methyltransferase [Methylacidiphilales bacterium]|nr:DNA methyltransferase [Candidatus Methylacidiphilales bacterium]